MADTKKGQLFGEIAIALGFITSADLAKALETQAAGELWGIGFILMRLGKLTLEQIEEILTYQEVSFVNIDEELEPEDYEHQRIGEIAVSAKAIKYSDLLHALEQKSRMKELDGTEPKLGKVLVDLNLITEDQLKSLLTKGGINVYQCQRCNRIYNVKRFSTREFCCPFCHYRDQMSYESDVLNIEGQLQVGNFKSLKSRVKETQKFIVEHNLGKIGRYEILEEIGIGRMGVVSKVREEKTGKIYALKAFIIDNEYKETTLNYFEHHFTRYQQLAHDNIAKVLEFDRYESLVYAVFEYTDGIPFDLWILREGADERKRVKILKEIAQTLAYAHENNVYHLNLHPGNIFVDKSGKIKITDFALPAPLIDTSIDNPVFGMRKYLAPENFRFDVGSLEGKTDQFAFGCIAYETMTSNSPFSGITLSETFRQLEKTLPPSIESKNLLPYRDFENVIFKCMEPRIALRYTNMFEVVDDIRAVLGGETPDANPVTWSRRLFHRYGKTIKTFGILASAALILLIVQFFFMNETIEKSTEPAQPLVDSQFQLIDSAKNAFEQKQYDNVREIIGTMEKDTQDDPEVMGLLLKLEDRDENYEKILTDYRKNKDLGRNLTNVLIAVKAARELADYDRASEILLSAYSYHRDNEKIYPELMSLLNRLQRWEKLLEISEYALSTLDVKNDYFAYACLSAGKLKRWNKSQTYFMQALASSTNKALAYYYRALVNFDRLGKNIKQNLNILDNVRRDAIKAQSLDPRIPGNAYFLKQVNRETIKIRYAILASKVKLEVTRDSNALIEAANLRVQLDEYTEAQMMLERVNFNEVSGKNVLTAANVYFVCKNYQAVLRLLKIAEGKQNLLLNDYILLIKTQYLNQNYVQAFITSQKALSKFPDNYQLLYESARTQIKFGSQQILDQFFTKLESNSLYQTKNQFLQALMLDEKRQFISEIELLKQILSSANPLTEQEIYDEAINKLLYLKLHVHRKLVKKDITDLVTYIQVSRNSGLLLTQAIKQLLRSGYTEFVEHLHKIAKLEIPGAADFETEINLLKNIYTFKHALILTKLANGEDLRGFVVNDEDLAIVSELSDRQDVKNVSYNRILQNIDNSWSDKALTLKNINNLIGVNGFTIDKIVNSVSSNTAEIAELKRILSSKQAPADYFTFIKSWGAENLSEKLNQRISNGKYFECLNYLDRYKPQKPKEEITEIDLRLRTILGFAQETMRELALYKETFLKPPKDSLVEHALLFALRERNAIQYDLIVNQFKDQLSKPRLELFNALRDFIFYPDRRDVYFRKLKDIVVNITENADAGTSRLVQVFTSKAIEFGFFKDIKESLYEFSDLAAGLDSEYLYFLEIAESGLLQTLQIDLSELSFDKINTRNESIKKAIVFRLSGFNLLSDFVLEKIPGTMTNDKTLQYLKALYDETADKYTALAGSTSLTRIQTFLDYNENMVARTPTNANFNRNFDNILLLMKIDKLISENQIELADAMLESFDKTRNFEDIVSFLKKKIHYAKGEYNLSAQITTKSNYAGLLNLQLLSELQSDDARIFQDGIDRLITDSSIGSNLLFDASKVIFTSTFKLSLEQINSIFKQRSSNLSSDPKLLLAQAILLKSIDMSAESDKKIEELMRFHPQNAEVYYVAIQLAIIENNFEKAQEIIKAASAQKVQNSRLTEFEILMLILDEQYAPALDKALKLLTAESTSSQDSVIKYLLFLSAKLPPATQRSIFNRINDIAPNEEKTNELVLINSFMLDDVDRLYEVADRLYQNAIEKTKYAKWIIWALCRQEKYADALALAEVYKSKNDQWILGAIQYCKSMLDNESVEEIRQYLRDVIANSDNPELKLWGSLIAKNISEDQIAQRLKTEGSDLLPDNPSAVYNLIVDRINSNRYKDAETLITQGSMKFNNWVLHNLTKLFIAGRTGMDLAEIENFRELIRSTTDIDVFRMTFWLFQDMINKNYNIEDEVNWMNDHILKENVAIMGINAEITAEVLTTQGILAFKLGKYKQAQQLWSKASDVSNRFGYMKSYADTIEEAFKPAE